jgi:hypothetical protein
MVPATCFAQDPQALRHAVTVECKMDFYILLSDKKINYQDTLFYTWFKSQKVHTTQGRSAGNLLHGNFSKHHLNGQLAEQGSYAYGLKNGEWTTWTTEGQLQDSKTYKNGRLKGDFANYDADGSISEKGKYKNGKKKLDRIYLQAQKSAENDTLNPTKSERERKLFRNKEITENSAETSENEPSEKVTLWQKIFKKEAEEYKRENSEKEEKPKKEKKVKEDRIKEEKTEKN